MKRILISLALAAAAVSCTTAEKLNIHNAPIGADVAQDQVAQRIERALSNKGWQVAARQPGVIDAFIVVREHRAEVRIAYDHDSYSIDYRGSANLDERGDNIHRNYNRWVANLNTEIQRVMAGSR